jgi:hypothetical protein
LRTPSVHVAEILAQLATANTTQDTTSESRALSMTTRR